MANYDKALQQVRDSLGLLETDETVGQIKAAKDDVISRYQPIFAGIGSGAFPEAEFRGFLRFNNNKHWSGLHRQEKSLSFDLGALQKALSKLADKSTDVAGRLDYAVSSVKGMGKGLATAILLILEPDTYGVWNSTSEAGLKAVEMWPKFDRGASLGTRYVQINQNLSDNHS